MKKFGSAVYELVRGLFWLFVALFLASMIFGAPRFDDDAAAAPEKTGMSARENLWAPPGKSGMSPRRSVPAAPGVRVFDGDTFTLQGEKIRIANIDTPELFSPHCDSESRLAHMARARLVQLLSDPAGISLERQDKPDMFGRTLARVSVGGKDIGQTLIGENLAVQWEGKRHSWCCW